MCNHLENLLMGGGGGGGGVGGLICYSKQLGRLRVKHVKTKAQGD